MPQRFLKKFVLFSRYNKNKYCSGNSCKENLNNINIKNIKMKKQRNRDN
jgi:hypothetical protein